MQAVKKAAALPAGEDEALKSAVTAIIAGVKTGGERALLDYERRFDNVHLESVLVEKAELKAALAALQAADPATVKALSFAAERIGEFATKQKECLLPLHYKSLIPGLELGHSLSPVERCGCYVPAGRHPLPSSALMSVVTAKTAGVPYVAACSPPAAGVGGIHPAVLAALEIAGADEVFCMGGAQAIAAFAYGAGAVSPVDIIVGPGSRYVTEAKRQVLGDVGIDGLAGPSEVLIIADTTARADCIACDLLAQAEHDPASKAVLAATDDALIHAVIREIAHRLQASEADGTMAQAWEQNGEIYLAESLDEAAAFANALAPEHLELLVAPQHEAATIAALKSYGSLFVGPHAPVALGDFVSGPNHILPTMRTARFASGLWAGAFLRVQFHQHVSCAALTALAPPCIRIADVEGLPAHAESVKVRLPCSPDNAD